MRSRSGTTCGTATEHAIAGQTPIKRNRFVRISGGKRTVNHALAEKARKLAGVKAYVTNLTQLPANDVIAAYHHLFQIEASFRMARSDLRARPIYHHTKDSIKAHLTIVFTALAVGRWIENAMGWSIRRYVQTLRRYRTIEVRVGGQTLTAADPLPDEIAAIVTKVEKRAGAH